MKSCLDVEMLVEGAAPQLKEIISVGDALADENDEEVCAEFSHQVSMLEASLKQTFRCVTLLVKKSTDLDEVANVWETTSRYCGGVLEKLSSLKEKFPSCGTPELYDLAQDYREACEDRLRNVKEEIECQNISLPTGLLPEMS